MHRMQPRMLVVLAQHVQPLALLQVRNALVLSPLFDGDVLMVVVAVIVGLAVSERAFSLKDPRRGEAMERVTAQQEVSAEGVPSMNVQTAIGVSQGLPHCIPVERRVGEPFATWDGADSHERGHHASSFQTTDSIHGVHACNTHRHGH